MFKTDGDAALQTDGSTPAPRAWIRMAGGVTNGGTLRQFKLIHGFSVSTRARRQSHLHSHQRQERRGLGGWAEGSGGGGGNFNAC